MIFETYIGLDRRLALILGGVNSTVYALSAFGSYPMIERLGRRKMFLFGTAGQMFSMVNTFSSSIHTLNVDAVPATLFVLPDSLQPWGQQG